MDVLKQELADLGFESFVDSENGFSAYISSLEFLENKVSSLLQNHNDLIHTYTLKEHPYENWNEKWESSFDPVVVSSTCVIRASFHMEFGCDYEYSCVRDNKTGEIIDETGNIMGLVEEGIV